MPWHGIYTIRYRRKYSALYLHCSCACFYLYMPLNLRIVYLFAFLWAATIDRSTSVTCISFDFIIIAIDAWQVSPCNGNEIIIIVRRRKERRHKKNRMFMFMLRHSASANATELRQKLPVQRQRSKMWGHSGILLSLIYNLLNVFDMCNVHSAFVH